MCTYIMHRYRPRLSLRAWRQIVGFSFWTWMLAWVSLIRDRIDAFAIGRLLGATQVGLSSIAFEVGFLPTTELVGPICRALFPGLVQVRNRGSDVADAYFRAISATLVITLPAGVGIALVSDPLVRLAVGPRWVAAIPLVQIFAVIGIFRVVTSISTTLLSVYGMLQVQFASSLVLLAIRLGLLLVLIAHFGLIGSGYAAGAVAILEEAFYLIVTFRRFNLRPTALFASNWRPAIASAAMGWVVLSMGGVLGWGATPTFGQLAAQVLGGAVAYAIVLFVAWRAAGSPWGAEAQVLAVAREAARVVQRRWAPVR
jgi:lipopolysaccharide exporter